MLLNTTPTLRHATQADWPAIKALLLANKLPTDGAQAHLNTYLLAVANGEIVGSLFACSSASMAGQSAWVAWRRVGVVFSSMIWFPSAQAPGDSRWLRCPRAGP